MRFWVIPALTIALLSYILNRPAAPPAVPTTLAAVPGPAAPGALPSPSARAEPAQPPAARSSALPASSAPAQPQGRPQPSQATAPTEPSRAKRAADVLTVAAIAALLVEESRRAYHARNRPCACPDDSMRNGRACGGRSAFSRPGGAAPLCYPADITAEMIKDYRARQLAAR